MSTVTSISSEPDITPKECEENLKQTHSHYLHFTIPQFQKKVKSYPGVRVLFSTF